MNKKDRERISTLVNRLEMAAHDAAVECKKLRRLGDAELAARHAGYYTAYWDSACRVKALLPKGGEDD